MNAEAIATSFRLLCDIDSIALQTHEEVNGNTQPEPRDNTHALRRLYIINL